MKRFASEINKKRFTIKYPDGSTRSFGTCNPEDDERYDIIKVIQKRFGEDREIETYPQYVLAKYQIGDLDYSRQDIGRTLLPDGALVANGYYEREWDSFVSPEDWINQ